MGEAAAGIGLMLGPVIGSFLNTSVGYLLTFFIFSGLLFFNGILCWLILPSSLNAKSEE